MPLSRERFDPDYQYQFFCFEPMSHAPDDHHRPGGGNLVTLQPGESMEQHLSLSYTIVKQ